MSSIVNELIKTFGEQKRWVSWSYQTIGGRETKVPLGKSDDASTWSTLTDLRAQGKNDVGLMFGLKKQLLGIDIDHCVKDGNLDHPDADQIFDLLKVADTYCEISPSGTGLHLYLQIEEPLDLLAKKHAPYEFYTNRRYFTVTFNPFGIERPVRTVNVAEANEILAITGYPWKKEDTREAPTVEVVAVFGDEELLKRMFNAKGGAKIRELYNGDTSMYNNDHSNADMALLSHLAFWTQGNRDQMERIWAASPLGNRAKTKERPDYRVRSIDHALQQCKEFYKPRSKQVRKVEDEVNEVTEFDVDIASLGLHSTVTKDGVIKYPLVQKNINVVFDRHPAFKDRFRFDDFYVANQIKVDGEWEIQRDIHEIHIQDELSTILPMFNRVSPVMIQRAIAKVSADNRMDSAKDYITSLVWDQVPRIETWLQEVFGVEDDVFTRSVGSNWMKGLADRMAHPGCQFDYILVVEGAQGMRKSSAFRELVRGEWHLETERSPGDKDFLVEMAGKAVIELSEGQSNATIDVKKMKSIITKRKDTYRSPYGRTAEDHPRHSVFCMTTNDDEYLKDTTGDRRWWPVRATKKADVAWIRENRDQLFAEAYWRITKGKETTYEVPEDMALERQEDRRQKDPNTEIIVNWYRGLSIYKKKEGITTYDAFIGSFFRGQEPQNVSMTRLQQISIGSVLRSTLQLERKREMSEGIRTYKYFDPKVDQIQSVMDLPIGSPIEKEKVEEREPVPAKFEDF